MHEHDHEPMGEDECLHHKRFLQHEVQVHLQRQKLKDAMARKDSWIFAMRGDCVELAVKMSRLHAERTGECIDMALACCLRGSPAFLIFPKEHLAYYEIEELFDIEVADSKEAAEKCGYFVISVDSAQELRVMLSRWEHQDHLTN